MSPINNDLSLPSGSHAFNMALIPAQITPKTRSAIKGLRTTTQTVTVMPEGERDCGPDDDDIPWDQDVVYPLDDDEDEGEEGE